jgi:hypothetical protein
MSSQTPLRPSGPVPSSAAETTPSSGLPRLTRAFLGWAAVDIVGVLVLALGAAFIIEGRASITPGFPADTMQAWICIGLGTVTVFIAAVKMVVEVLHANTAPPPAE